MINSIVNPTPSDAMDFIEKYHKSNPDKTMLLLVGDCMVDYIGRTRSFLDWGERMIMIKRDGTVLVHQPTMRESVNWQPSGSTTEFKVNNQHLVMRCRHSGPLEKMKITFRNIKTIMVTQLCDKASLVISGMEADVVNEIISNPDIIEEGLRISKREKHVKSGSIDLFGFDKDHLPVVIEVRRSIGNISAVQQIRMYVSDVKKDIESANVRGILRAPKIPDMPKKLLADYGLEWREVERKVDLSDDWQKTLKNFSD